LEADIEGLTDKDSDGYKVGQGDCDDDDPSINSGAFVGFSSSSTTVDFDNRRLRFSNDYFGFIKSGRWISVEPVMKLGIRHEGRAWRAYSRSNRTLDISTDDLRIFLFTSNGRVIMPVMKTDTHGSAEAELEKLGNKLNLSTI